MNLCERGNGLLREIRDSSTIPPYNSASLNVISREMLDKSESMLRLRESLTPEAVKDPAVHSSFVIQSTAIKRNIRCVFAYLHNRLDRVIDLWWSCGHSLPNEIKINLSSHELAAYEAFDQMMLEYVEAADVSVGTDQQPPKEYLIEVEALEDVGELMTEQGPVDLRKHSRHYMRRSDCELLIKQGLIRQIVNKHV